MVSDTYLFRNFRLDPATRELRKDDDLVVLPGSAFDCLVYLVEHRERAVGRDELIAAVWGRVDVADTLLAQTVLRVRRTLGDSGSEGAIRTVARFGYRWVEETCVEQAPDRDPATDVTPLESALDQTTSIRSTSLDADSAPLRDDLAPASTRSRRPLSLAFGALVVFALLIGAAFWISRGADLSKPASDSTQSVAASDEPALVLPAEVMDAANWGWLRLGLMDLIGDRLRQSGLPTATGETVLAMLAAQPTLSADSHGLRVQPRAAFRDGQWTVSLQAQRDGDSLQVEASSEDVLAAARMASDLLSVHLGYAPPQTSDVSRPLALEELLQRTKAAILADQFDLARHLIEQAPESLRGNDEVELRRAQIDQGRGAYDEAEARLRALADRVTTEADSRLRGRVLNALGVSQFRRGHAEEASATFAEAIALLEKSHDPIVLASAYAGRAAIASQEERLADAAADLGRARVEMEAGGDALGIAQVDMNLGLIEVRNYRPAQAMPLLEGAEARIAAIGAREELAYVRYSLAGVQLQMLDYDRANATIARFWPPEAHTGNQRLRWQLVLMKAFVLHATGHYNEAEALLSLLEREADAADDEPVLARAKALRVLLLAGRGRPDEAAAMAESTLTPSFAERQPDMTVTIRVMRLRNLRMIGRIADAARELAVFRDWVDAHPNAWRKAYVSLASAEQAAAEQRHDEALADFSSAFKQIEALAIPDDLVEIGEPFTLALLDQGDVGRASAVVGRLAAWAEIDVRAAWAQSQLYRAQGRTSAWQRASERVARLAGERTLPAPRID